MDTLSPPIRTLSSSRGRLRFHLPGWSDEKHVEQEVRRFPGVRRVEANSLTGNVLVYFDPEAITPPTLLDGVRSLQLAPLSASPAPPEAQVVSIIPGRMRVSYSEWIDNDSISLQARLRETPGVLQVEANATTGTLLLLFDEAITTSEALLDRIRSFPRPAAGGTSKAGTDHDGERSARIAFRGLDRQPRLARQVIQLLQRNYGVRARLKAVTGHLVIDYNHDRVLLEDLLIQIAHLELPELPGEDRPRHPLDPEPLVEGITRAVGTLLGMAVLSFRRLILGASVGNGFAGGAAGILHMLQGFPFVRDGLRRLVGRHTAGVVSTGLSILASTFANHPMGLITAGAETLLLLGEITARRMAWRRYEERLDGAASAEPGAVIRLEAGMRVPHAGRVIEGHGSAMAQSGLPIMLAPGGLAPAGAVLSGGPFVLEMQAGKGFEPQPRPGERAADSFHRYLRIIGPVSLAYAAFTGIRTRSLLHTFESLLLLNPRTAVIARDAANLGAAARSLRGGLTVVGTRPDRIVHLPDVLLLDGPRLLIDRMETAGVHPFAGPALPEDLLDLAAVISSAAGSPWGKVFPPARGRAREGAFNGLWASAVVDGVKYTLGPPEDEPTIPDGFAEEHEGGYLLEVCSFEDGCSLGFVALRPRLVAWAAELVATCQRLGVRVELLPTGAPLAAAAMAGRIGLPVGPVVDPMVVIRERQRAGLTVGFVSDHSEAAAAFEACDLAVGLSSGRGDFPARADVLAPDLRGVTDLLEAATRREAVVKDGVTLSIIANGVGVLFGARGPLGIQRASLVVYLAALTGIGVSWLRLRGGIRPESTLAHLTDPRPERWGRRDIEDVLRAFNTTSEGLGYAEAMDRRVQPPSSSSRDQLLSALRNQVRAPITAILASGACLTLALGQPLNTMILGTTISLNIVAGVWQERQIGLASEALQRLGAATAQVMRDGIVARVPASEVVPGDVLELTPGDRVSADARVIDAANLEIDEASLTGESLPVSKGPDENNESGRIVLEGSDVVVGTGRAVVVAVGRQTRLGATAAALNVERDEDSPLGARLGRILKVAVPVAGAGGLLAGLAGLVYGGAPMAMFTLSVTTALSAIPEGLPLLAGVGQAGVASRLSRRKAIVRRIGAVEALGRVDIACTDKTGTLTEGRLALRLVADFDRESAVPGLLPPELVDVILAAALACPHPDAPNAISQTTDAAVVRGALAAGLEGALRAPRRAEVPFDSKRGYYASLFADRLCVKGAPERLLPRCAFVQGRDGPRFLEWADREPLLARVASLAERGLRVLMAAYGPPDTDPDDPRGLTVLGFVGITDPLRPTVPEAVRRCLAAGVRVIMLTGDHPATARAIAAEAGLLGPGHAGVMRAAEIAELPAEELNQRLEGVAVIARATPMDKLRIIESLRERGHTVAMTGDGVNDAPSLRLADVGVAMGRSGTEVARQAADVVLLDDDFATLVEALVEGRGFWRNMRSGLGLLLGGNVGELGLIVGGNLLGYGSPLSTAQILIVNMVTDALPCLAVVLQQPEHRNLAGLAREGLSALDSGLRRDVLRRGIATAVPSLATYLFMHGVAGPIQASAVAFTGVVATQLAQTLDAGRVEGTLSRSVAIAVGGSIAMLLGVVTIPPLRNFLGLVTPNPLGWGLIAANSAAGVAISRAISLLERRPANPLALPLLPAVIGEGRAIT